MNFIQEVLNLLDRKQDKKELKLTKDWFEFGRQKPSSVGNPLYSPKMTPHAIRFDDLKCEIISGLISGTGTEHTLPMWSTVDANNCDVQTLIDSVFSQSSDATLGVVSANLLVKGDTEIDGDLLVHGKQTIIESTIVEIADNIIFLNTQGADVDAGFEVGTVNGKKLWGWDATNLLWSSFGEDIMTENIVINKAIKMDGEALINVVNEAEGLASNDNDESLATVAAIIDWSDQMDLDVSADTGTPLDILLNSETLQIRGGSNITTNADGGEKIRIDLNNDISVNSVTTKYLALAGDPGIYTVTSIVNNFADVVDPNLTLLTAKAIVTYVDDQRDYVKTVALNGPSLDFNGVGNAFGGSVDVSALVNKTYTIEPSNSASNFGIISLLEDGVVNSSFKVVPDNEWLKIASNGAELRFAHKEIQSVGVTSQAITLTSGDTFTTFEYVFDNAGHVVSREEVDYTLNITGGGSTPVMSKTVTGTGKLFSDTVQTEDANAVTNTPNRTYGVQFNDAQELVVNVPWTTGSGADGNDFVSNVAFDANSSILSFTGSGGAFNGSVNLSTLTNTYGLTSSTYLGGANLNLLGTNGSQDTVKILPGTGISMALGTNEITISSTVSDTTYDFGAAGAGGNINIALTGSDGSNDVVEIKAGNNITLTDNGSNVFTIDAAGGGTADGVVTDVAVNGLDLDFTGSNGGFNGTIPILDIAPVQKVVGDGTAISSSYDAGTGQTMITPIFNNVPTQNSQALVNSGGIWAYIDALTFPNDFVNNVRLDTGTNTLDFSGTGGAFSGSVSLAGYDNQNSFETIKIANSGTFPAQSPVVADSPTDTVGFTAGRGITITSDPAADEVIWSQRISLLGGLDFNSDDELGLKTVSPTGSSSAQTIKDGDTFLVPTVTFDKFGRASAVDTKTVTLDAPGGSGTDTCVYGQTGTGSYSLTAVYAPLAFSGSTIGFRNISGARGNYVITYSIQFNPSGATGFKSFDTKIVAQTAGGGAIDLFEFNDTVYAASDAKFTKTFTYTAPNLADQDAIEIHIKGNTTLVAEKVSLSVVATDCEASNSSKVEVLTER